MGFSLSVKPAPENKDPYLKMKLAKPALAEQIEKQELDYIKNLRGGIYHAPSLYTQMQSLLNDFFSTGKLTEEIILKLHFSSDSSINATVQSSEKLKPKVTEIKAYYIMFTKGLLDLVTHPELYQAVLGDELVAKIQSRSKSILAFVLAHELGHIMNGDTEKATVTTKVYQELAADDFSVRLVAQAGYDPEGAIDILQALSKIYVNKTLWQKISASLDAHPKPWFRIAALSETIDHLKNSQSARIEMGLKQELKPKADRRFDKIEARGDEKVSRTSIEVVKRLTESDVYKQSSPRENERLLENLLFKVSAENSNLLTSNGVVATVKAYAVVLNKISSLEDIDDLISSLNNFEKNMGELASQKGRDESSDSKAAFRVIKAAIIDKQIEAVKLSNPDLFSASGKNDIFQQLEVIGPVVDKKYTMGELYRMVSECNDIEELSKILEFFVHRGFQFKARFKETGRSLDQLDNELYAKTIRRYLHLSQNLEKTLDFVQLRIPLTQARANSKPSFRGIDPMMGEIALEIVENPNISLDNFNERLANPKTANDKIFAQSVFLTQNNNSNRFVSVRERVATSGHYNAESIHHLQSGKNVRQITLTPELTTFFILSFGRTSGQALMSSLSKNQYTAIQVVELLQKNSEKSQAYWAQYLEYLKNPNVKKPGDSQIQFHVKSLQSRILLQKLFDAELIANSELNKGQYTMSEFLVHLNKNSQYSSIWQELTENIKSSSIFLASERHQATVLMQMIIDYHTERNFEIIPRLEASLKDLSESYFDLEKLKAKTSELLAQRVGPNLVQMTTSVTLDENNKNIETSRKSEIPIFTPKNLEVLNNLEKAKLFTDIIENDEKNRIKQYARGLIDELPNVQVSLELAVQQREVPAAVRDEFVAKLRHLLELAGPTLNDSVESIPFAYFKLRRELRIYFDTLCVGKYKIEDLLNSESIKGLAGLLDSNQNSALTKNFGRRVTELGTAAEILKAFITPTDGITNEILEGKNPKALADFVNLAREFSLKIAHYEGFTEADIKGKKLGQFFKVKHSDAYSNARKNDVDKMAFQSDTFAEFLNFDSNTEMGRILSAELRKDPKTTVQQEMREQYGQWLKEKWVMLLYRFATTTSATEAMLSSGLLVEIFNEGKKDRSAINDSNARFTFITWTQALNLVKTKTDMEAVTFLVVQIGAKLGLERLVTDFLTTDLSKLFSVYTIKYREKFFNSFVKKIAEYDAWMGQVPDVKTRIKLFYMKVLDNVQMLISVVAAIEGLAKFLAKEFLKIPLNDNRTLFGWINMVAARHDVNMISKGLDENYFGRTDHAQVFEKIRKLTPWSLDVDYAILTFIRNPIFKGKKWSVSRREYLAGMVKNIRSLKVRTEAYRYLLDTYGDFELSPGKKITTAIKLLKTYWEVRDLWGEKVIEDLKRAPNILDKLMIIETAWERRVADRAQRLGITKEKAIETLQKLKSEVGKFQMPAESEAEDMFPEASRHRDEFLDRSTKKRPMTVENLTMVESMKSRNSETPYHLASKMMLEMMDEYAGILTPLQKAKFILYMAAIDPKLDPVIEKTINARFFATTHRSESLKQKGLKFKINEIRDYVAETHPEERLVAYRALFLRGISGNAEAEELLINRLLFADKNMPEYLRKVMNIYLRVLKPSELATRLMWLMSNNVKGETLEGPELLRLLIEFGGVTEKKMAQLIASHGFNLPREYQTVLEIFKGNAQKVAKMTFINIVRERLPREKFDQIATFDKELGSGSMKIGYLVTLKDGRKVVIMAMQDLIYERTVREFEIARAVIKAIQADPDLRIDNLDALEKEMERIIKTEMNFINEAKLMKLHKATHEARPWLIRKFGNITKVLIPQPLSDWSADGLLFEEYVESKKFSQLEPTSMVGWSQKDMSKAAINEQLNQLLVYLDAPKSGVVINIDMHEENQLAQHKKVLGTKKSMVMIDTGQSKIVQPEVVRGLVKAILLLALKRTEESFQVLEKYVNFQNDQQRRTFWEIFYYNAAKYLDPVEAMTQTLEKVELKGIMLKEEFLYFQKMFATLVGLKRHVGDEYYIIKQVAKLFSLRLLGSPIAIKNELFELMKETPIDEKNREIIREPGQLRCEDIVVGWK
jgi:hypothetical protein